MILTCSAPSLVQSVLDASPIPLWSPPKAVYCPGFSKVPSNNRHTPILSIPPLQSPLWEETFEEKERRADEEATPQINILLSSLDKVIMPPSSTVDNFKQFQDLMNNGRHSSNPIGRSPRDSAPVAGRSSPTIFITGSPSCKQSVVRTC